MLTLKPPPSMVMARLGEDINITRTENWGKERTDYENKKLDDKIDKGWFDRICMTVFAAAYGAAALSR